MSLWIFEVLVKPLLNRRTWDSLLSPAAWPLLAGSWIFSCWVHTRVLNDALKSVGPSVLWFLTIPGFATTWNRPKISKSKRAEIAITPEEDRTLQVRILGLKFNLSSLAAGLKEWIWIKHCQQLHHHLLSKLHVFYPWITVSAGPSARVAAPQVWGQLPHTGRWQSSHGDRCNKARCMFWLKLWENRLHGWAVICRSAIPPTQRLNFAIS